MRLEMLKKVNREPFYNNRKKFNLSLCEDAVLLCCYWFVKMFNPSSRMLVKKCMPAQHLLLKVTKKISQG